MHWGNAILLIGMGVVPAVGLLVYAERWRRASAVRFADPVNLLLSCRRQGRGHGSRPGCSSWGWGA